METLLKKMKQTGSGNTICNCVQFPREVVDIFCKLCAKQTQHLSFQNNLKHSPHLNLLLVVLWRLSVGVRDSWSAPTLQLGAAVARLRQDTRNTLERLETVHRMEPKLHTRLHVEMGSVLDVLFIQFVSHLVSHHCHRSSHIDSVDANKGYFLVKITAAANHIRTLRCPSKCMYLMTRRGVSI